MIIEKAAINCIFVSTSLIRTLIFATDTRVTAPEESLHTRCCKLGKKSEGICDLTMMLDKHPVLYVAVSVTASSLDG